MLAAVLETQLMHPIPAGKGWRLSKLREHFTRRITRLLKLCFQPVTGTHMFREAIIVRQANPDLNALTFGAIHQIIEQPIIGSPSLRTRLVAVSIGAIRGPLQRHAIDAGRELSL